MTARYDQAAYRQFKASLTRAVNRQDDAAILRACAAFDAFYEGYSPPDDWHRWRVAREEAEGRIRRRQP